MDRRKVLVLASLFCMLAAPAWAQVPGRMVLTSPDGTREVEVSPGQAIYVTCPDGTCTGGGGVAAAIDLTKIGGVVLGGADVVDVPNTAFRVNCVVGCTPSTPFTDNSAFTFGTTSINVTGYVFDDVAPNAVTENRAAAPRMSGNRVPYSILRDAAGNERGANVNSLNELKVSLGDIIGVESAVTIHSGSLQIGGAVSPGGEWHAATVTNAQPGASAYGLVVRDPSALSVNSGGLNTTGYGINTYSRSDSAVHSMESRDSIPLGTEYGLLTRPIWDTQVSQLHNTIANPTRSIQLGGAEVDGATYRHIGASNAEPGSSGVGMFVRNISGMGTPGSAVIGQVNVIGGRDPNTNIVRQVEVLTAAPAGTEGGVITRNIPSGIQPISVASLPLPTGAATETTLGAILTEMDSALLDATTATLGISGVYTSAALEVATFAKVTVVAFSDKASAVSGLRLWWSNDGVNFSDVSDPLSYNVAANFGTSVVSNVKGRYLKVIYTNGVVAQTTFRMHTVGHRTGIGTTDNLAVAATNLIASNFKTEVTQGNFNLLSATARIDQTTPGTTNAVAVTNAFGLEATQLAGNVSLATLAGAVNTTTTENPAVLVVVAPQNVPKLLSPYRCNALRKTNCSVF